MGKKGYALLEVIAWAAMTGLIIIVIAATLTDTVSFRNLTMEHVSAMGDLVNLDSSIMEDIARGPGVLQIVSGEHFVINGSSYFIDNGNIVRSCDGKRRNFGPGELEVGTIYLNSQDYLHVVATRDDLRLDRIYRVYFQRSGVLFIG